MHLYCLVMKVIKEISSGLLILNKCILQLPGKKRGGGADKAWTVLWHAEYCWSLIKHEVQRTGHTLSCARQLQTSYLLQLHYAMLHAHCLEEKPPRASKRTELTVLKLSKALPQQAQSNTAEEVPSLYFQLDKNKREQWEELFNANTSSFTLIDALQLLEELKASCLNGWHKS